MPYDKLDVKWEHELESELIAKGEIEDTRKSKSTELSILEKYMQQLSRMEIKFGNIQIIIGMKTPNNILSKVKEIFINRRDTSKKFKFVAKHIYYSISKIASILEHFFKHDILNEKRLERICRNKSLSIKQLKERLMKLKKREEHILSELYSIVKYWDQVKNSGKLPRGRLGKKYNDTPILYLFKHIENEDRQTIQEMEALLPKTI